ncbi:MAG: cytochrome d ubiquinol oxidase subunit II [Halothiobacillaceae bacterium]
MLDLTLIWVALIGFGVLMYVVADGFDLGVGILFLLSPDEGERDLMMSSVAPVWDGNETWLILGGAGLLAAFPMIYAVFLPALYLGVFLMLAGLILRGVAFEFRLHAADARGRRFWGQAFGFGSLLAAFAQGVVVGAYVQGFEVVNGQYAGGAFDWLTPFTVLTGVALVFGYVMLGVGWLLLKTDGPLAVRMRGLGSRAWWVLAILIPLAALSSLLVQPLVGQRWATDLPLLVAGLAVLVFLMALLRRSLQRPEAGEGRVFLLTLGVFLLCYLGLLASMWPYAVPSDYSFHDAASDRESQLFILIGALVVVPLVLAYTAWTYWLFRGKVRASDNHGGH